MPLKMFICDNCGFWQKHFAVPSDCSVCSDVRHVLPENGFRFLTPDETAAGFSCEWREYEPGITMFWNTPRIGIGPSGYLIQHPEGNIAFEATGWYTDAALDYIAERGGIRFLSASHPHAYGAFWLLQEKFKPEATMLHVDDLGFTKAFKTDYPFDDRLELLPGVRLLHTGGHFAGHTILYHAARRILFAGDALKFHHDETPVGISCHKAFVNRIPLSHAEVHRYRNVIAPLDFTQVFTTFEHAKASTADAVRLFDQQLAGRSFFGSIPMTETAKVLGKES